MARCVCILRVSRALLDRGSVSDLCRRAFRQKLRPVVQCWPVDIRRDRPLLLDVEDCNSRVLQGFGLIMMIQAFINTLPWDLLQLKSVQSKVLHLCQGMSCTYRDDISLFIFETSAPLINFETSAPWTDSKEVCDTRCLQMFVALFDLVY